MDPKVLDQMLSNSSFTKEQADMIKSKHSFISLKPNEVLLSQGNVCNFEAFLIKGLLRSYYTIEGNERIIQFFKEGDCVSDFKSYLSQKPSKLTIQAIEGSEFFICFKKDLDDLTYKIPSWNNYRKKFYEDLFIIMENITESILTTSPEERYTTLLNETPELINRLPQYYVAQYVGVKPESLSRMKRRIIGKRSFNINR
ncbi:MULTISPECIES: Crp/Fnr family transcriptional regulator [Aquimarina]|uniref:Crp/Fnr family transcriptional regulator n=1 Tax=Aquimarina TaxID=290174 RepID=UPI0009423CC7|nr:MULTISPECIES: Crp/Fnr family transcriptional regulator [Aquimarina]